MSVYSTYKEMQYTVLYRLDYHHPLIYGLLRRNACLLSRTMCILVTTNLDITEGLSYLHPSLICYIWHHTRMHSFKAK